MDQKAVPLIAKVGRRLLVANTERTYTLQELREQWELYHTMVHNTPGVPPVMVLECEAGSFLDWLQAFGTYAEFKEAEMRTVFERGVDDDLLQYP